MNIKIKYNDEHGKKLQKLTQGDWIDLYCAENTMCELMKPALIPLGVTMKLPEGYEAILAPRSSTFRKYGIIQTNGIGVIDESYCGPNDEWKLPVICLSADEPIMIQTDKGNLIPSGRCGKMIPAGERIAQFRILKKMPEIEFTEVEEMEDPDRGGFGSTGRG